MHLLLLLLLPCTTLFVNFVTPQEIKRTSLLNKRAENKMFTQKTTTTTTTETSFAHEQEYAEEYAGGDAVFGNMNDEEELSSSTESSTKKVQSLVSRRPLRSNEDLLMALKKRRLDDKKTTPAMRLVKDGKLSVTESKPTKASPKSGFSPRAKHLNQPLAVKEITKPEDQERKIEKIPVRPNRFASKSKN